MIAPLIRYGPSLLAAVAVVVAVWWVMGLKADNASLRAETAALTLALDACNARTENIKKDQTSDAEVDALSDDDLRSFPDRWMFETPGAGGLY